MVADQGLRVGLRQPASLQVNKPRERFAVSR